ncbi:MAG: exodeoxyribonuclease VII large subunit [Clostridiales bacterium]|jgi:exodeoxyribonuclease VII large subunit|nr:exodeoxyribonuclease VII large subunit [Clostridiales bacterium]
MAIKPISVAQLNSYIKRVLQTDPLLGNVSVIGEVSNLKFHGLGHIFFTLKDQNSRVSCYISPDDYNNLRYELTEGMEITVSGYVHVYDRGGSYSLNVRDISVEGVGNLTLAYEKLKAKLEMEGLFDFKYKKSIPKFPKQIVIISSDTGAAVRDIIKIIKARNDIINIIVYPCLVQGEDAAADISQGITEVNELFPETDLIILGRGGGSIEDLWAFNEEIVARSIFLSDIPIISAVGHETDFTISDLVADKRAATPSEAAQIAVPEVSLLKETIEDKSTELFQRIKQIVQYNNLLVDRHNIDALKSKISDKIKMTEMYVSNLGRQNIYSMETILFNCSMRLEELKSRLDSLNPYAILDKGYALISNENGELAMGVGAFKPGDFLTVIFKDGKIRCSVNKVIRGK